MFTGRKSSLNTSKYTYECTETGKVRVYRSQKLSKHIEIHVRAQKQAAQKQAKYVFTGRKSSLNTSKYTYECTETGKVRVYSKSSLNTSKYTYECTETGKACFSKHIEIHVRVHRNRQSTCLQVAKAL